MKDTLRPTVKVIVKEIAYTCKSLKTTKKGRFLRTDHQNLGRENLFKDFPGIIWIENVFKPIRAINRAGSRAIWTRTHEDTDHFSKGPATHPRLKNNPRGLILSEGLMFQKRLVFWRIDACNRVDAYKGTP